MTLNKKTCNHLHIFRMQGIGDGCPTYDFYMCKSCDTVLLVPKPILAMNSFEDLRQTPYAKDSKQP